jgi:hypothetical protein
MKLVSEQKTFEKASTLPVGMRVSTENTPDVSEPVHAEANGGVVIKARFKNTCKPNFT